MGSSGYRNRKRPGVNNASRTIAFVVNDADDAHYRDAPLHNPRQRTTLVTIIELPAAAIVHDFVRAEFSFSFALFVVFASQTSSGVARGVYTINCDISDICRYSIIIIKKYFAQSVIIVIMVMKYITFIYNV